MAEPQPPAPHHPHHPNSRKKARQLHQWVINFLQITMAIGLVGAIYEQQWQNVLLIVAIMTIFFIPSMLERRYQILIPAEFELMAVIFAYAALFLGEVQSYYIRFWWWDIALHALSGLLLGIVGFLLVYLLNESRNIDLHMRPRFVALFAFVFAVAVGALWEIFEFAMDQIFGTTMQKPMLGDPSGLTDTMWDLIIDTIGAAIISLTGWWYMHQEKRSFIYIWIRKFIVANPRFFR